MHSFNHYYIIVLYFNMSSSLNRLVDMSTGPMFSGMNFNKTELLGTGLGIRLLGPIFVSSFYLLLVIHVYSYFEVILHVLKKRLGDTFGLLWVGIGIAILYNIVYNHFFAMVIKPGSP